MKEEERNRHRRSDAGREPPSSEELLARCVAAIERGDTNVVAKICTEHPEHEAALRCHLSRLGHMGMLSQSEEVDSHSLGERLQEILQLPRSAQAAAIEAFCREHPELAPSLRERYDLMVRLRALGPHAMATQTGAASSDTAARQTIGPYRILGVLGEGGMGTVYLAEQRKPVLRRVALKLIKLGMDTKLVLRRFEGERQALAMMEHDSIAKVYEASATDDGRPYFVMQYVKGRPLTDYCDTQRLAIPERLALFQQVCAGVQHAHQKGVIHRDLKPSNVLVTIQGGQPVPKIIDFGLARATDHRLVEATIFTEQGLIVGTPEYMSPEQAGLGALDIDTRTDVYSLGVLLYELLVGALPFPGRELREAGLLELQRRIKEEEPPKPSTRLSGIGEESKHVAQARRTDCRRLLSRVRGDLDWITMKALDKDRTRRYGSAEALADDLRRYLDHEPVEAGPPSAAYRLKKFLRKRRGPVAAGVAIFLSLAVGLFVAVRALDAEAAALKEKSQALADLEKTTGDLEKTSSALRSALTDYQRMKDVPLGEDLLAEVDEDLWPAWPENAPRMAAWLARARDLASRAGGHRVALEALRTRAREPPARVRNQIEEFEKATRDRDAQRERLERARAHPRAKRLVPAEEQKLADLEKNVRAREGALGDTRWQFEKYEDRFLHRNLASLLANIDRLAKEGGLIEQIESRRERARTLGDRSLIAKQKEWREAPSRVAGNEKYRGMPALTPQLGLVPLGPDPDSKLEEFAVLDTGEVPGRDASGRLRIDGEGAIVLVLIPPALPGTFWMGAQKNDKKKPNYDPLAEPDESPVREVILEAFFLSKYEVTQGQWQRLMGTNPSVYGIGPVPSGTVTAQNPVENVTWDDCQEAMRRLGLALPTEAQWEYATRAGTSTAWWTGKEKRSLAGAVNLADRYCKEHGGLPDWRYDLEPELEDGHTVHASVGSFRANGFGLHDVIGNIFEWCRDPYGGYARDPRPGDGLRLHTGARSRVYRGGGWSDVARHARSANRYGNRPEARNGYIGCRPSRELMTR